MKKTVLFTYSTATHSFHLTKCVGVYKLFSKTDLTDLDQQIVNHNLENLTNFKYSKL